MKQHTKPCKNCPYLRKSAKGYLGNKSGKPQEFLNGYFAHEKHPCHKQVDYEGGKTKENIENSPSCAGFAIMCKNECKKPYNQETNKLIESVSIDNENVFSHSSEFIAHHEY